MICVALSYAQKINNVDLFVEESYSGHFEKINLENLGESSKGLVIFSLDNHLSLHISHCNIPHDLFCSMHLPLWTFSLLDILTALYYCNNACAQSHSC